MRVTYPDASCARAVKRSCGTVFRNRQKKAPRGPIASHFEKASAAGVKPGDRVVAVGDEGALANSDSINISCSACVPCQINILYASNTLRMRARASISTSSATA